MKVKAEVKPIRKLDRNKFHQIYSLKDGTIVPGTSTICKVGENPAFLIHWAWDCGRQGLDYKKVRDEAADIGTLAHFMLECHISGEIPCVENFAPFLLEKAQFVFEKATSFWKSQNFKLVAKELQLVSEKYEYGGTLDVVCRDGDGKLTLIDWKTSKSIYDSYIDQLSAYENLWNENNKEKIERRIIIRAGKKKIASDFDFHEFTSQDIKPNFEIFLHKLSLHNALLDLRN